MGIRQYTFTAPMDEQVVAINQEIEEITHGVVDDTVRAGANIGIEKLNRLSLGEVTMGLADTNIIIRHSLGVTPVDVIICPTTNGNVWIVPGLSDSKKIVLQANPAGTKAMVTVFG